MKTTREQKSVIFLYGLDIVLNTPICFNTFFNIDEIKALLHKQIICFIYYYF